MTKNLNNDNKIETVCLIKQGNFKSRLGEKIYKQFNVHGSVHRNNILVYNSN